MFWFQRPQPGRIEVGKLWITTAATPYLTPPARPPGARQRHSRCRHGTGVGGRSVRHRYRLPRAHRRFIGLGLSRTKTRSSRSPTRSCSSAVTRPSRSATANAASGPPPSQPPPLRDPRLRSGRAAYVRFCGVAEVSPDRYARDLTRPVPGGHQHLAAPTAWIWRSVSRLPPATPTATLTTRFATSPRTLAG